MDDTDKTEFCRIMYAVAENFSADISKDSLKIRFEILKEYPLEVVKKAAYQILKTRVYTTMPTVADFIQAIEGNQGQILEDMAETQAIQVLQQAREKGSYSTPRFEDPVTSAIMKSMFRWSYVCQMPEDKTRFFIKDFKSAYLAHARTDNKYKTIKGIGFNEKLDIDPEVKKLIKNIGGNNGTT